MKLVDSLKSAFSVNVTPERSIGCCRVYVLICDPEAVIVMSRIAKKHGYTFQKKAHYGLSNALYIGYDNCDGAALARGTAVVKALKAIGIDCYRTEHGD